MPLRFFLGGADLEMDELRKLLHKNAPDAIEDRQLSWGAALSSYRNEILAALANGETPVAVELRDDLPADLFDRRRVIFVDHHGADAGADRPTSIEQVFQLLHLPPGAWSRWLELVAANDRAHIRGLRAVCASCDEIARVRAADRRAQGVTPADEVEARRAIDASRRVGRVTVVDTLGTTSSAIVDFLNPQLGGSGYDRLLVAMPDEVAVFADGPAIRRLADDYPGSWWGGGLPLAGFWGKPMSTNDSPALSALIERLR